MFVHKYVERRESIDVNEMLEMGAQAANDSTTIRHVGPSPTHSAQFRLRSPSDHQENQHQTTV